MGNIQNLNNEYARLLGKLFDKTPKTVLAAIAVSALSSGGNDLEHIADRVAHEWECLSLNGIVPQKPTKLARGLAAHYAARKAYPGESA